VAKRNGYGYSLQTVMFIWFNKSPVRIRSLFSIVGSSEGLRIRTNGFFSSFVFANSSTMPLILAFIVVQTNILNIDSAPSIYDPRNKPYDTSFVDYSLAVLFVINT
jgi:hypothetical protein